MSRESVLAHTFVELADTLVEAFDVVDLLTVLTDSCVEILDVAAAGIMLADHGGQLRVMASSSEAMRLLELFEIQADEGPCLESYRTGRTVLSDDLELSDGGWPRFAAEALDAGFRAAQAVPMRLRGSVIGALNLFRVEPGRMGPADLEIAQAFADVATIAILQHRAVAQAQVITDQLTNALNSRILLEQAKGMLAERLNLDMERSFETMRAHARNHNLRLAEVAARIIDGTLNPADLDEPRHPSS